MKKVRITLWSIVAVAVAIAGGFWVSERGQIPIAAARVSVAESLLADFELTDTHLLRIVQLTRRLPDEFGNNRTGNGRSGRKR
jgi:hypothetical protein